MHILFNIEVGIEVPSFVQAGEILDQITRDLEEAIGSKGKYDIRNFQTHHTPIRKYPSEQDAMAATPDNYQR
jgi:hypothetical protein